MYSNNTSNPASKPLEVSKENPCPHCGKPDWCYSIGELSVCNRDQPPVTGWEATRKADKDGHFYYAPVQKKKGIRPAQTRYWEYPDRNGSPLVRVRRIDNGKNHKKDIKQQHWDKDKNDWVMGLGDVQRASIPIYRYADVQKAIANGDYIFIVDGEQCADALWALGLAATTCIGGAGKWRITDTSDLQGAKVVICPDRDSPGVEDAAKISQHFLEAQWLYCYPDSWVWDHLPKSQGLDVKDWIDDQKLSGQDLLNSLTPRPRTCEDVVRLSSLSSKGDYITDTATIAGQNFILKAEDALYSNGHYVSIGGVLYRFTGSYYEELNESKEKRRIGGWLKTYSEKVKGVWVKNRADTASVNAVFSWVVNQTAVDPVQVNPGGLNCTNGVVKINPDGSHLLVPHDPKNIYTYVGCKYDSNIDLTAGDRLLECLEPLQREIFLRTAAAALNLKLVRSKLTGRGVKGLLCYGEGSNGKDTLRAVLAAVFGRGMTGKSLSDFKSYDNGRKFSLAGIEGSICNWASENTAKVDLDGIQSLKQFITGDPIDIERKGKDSYEYKPTAIFFANCNKLPSITGGTAAIDDRYGILRFDKTYARNAIAAEGQLEADPRFKDDEQFILEQIAPAILNKMLERFPLLLIEGIDYKVTKDAMQKAQEESRHLWQFAREVGLEVQSGSRVWITDLWDLLVDWYEGMGILDKEPDGKGKEKLIWHELSNKYDAPVKSINQLSSRLSEIFPKIQVCRYLEREEIERRHQRYLLGVGFVQCSVKTAKLSAPSAPKLAPVDTARVSSVLESAPESVPKNIGADVGADSDIPRIVTQRDIQSFGADGADDSQILLSFCTLFSKLSDSNKQKLTELLTGVPCSDPLKAFRVGDKVAGNNPKDASYNWHGRIVEIHTSINCKVDWQEREGMRGGRVISMLFCNLRKI
jgi:putative DNA primase/helicase